MAAWAVFMIVMDGWTKKVRNFGAFMNMYGPPGYYREPKKDKDSGHEES